MIELEALAAAREKVQVNKFGPPLTMSTKDHFEYDNEISAALTLSQYGKIELSRLGA
jgi:hypothetical protein